MNDSNDESPKKIIIDEDWKSQVERERAEAASADAPKLSPTADEASQPADQSLPPASFELLITTLATQAMVYLGQIPDPVEQKAIVQLDVAKHHIDMLCVIQDKTSGNLTNDEKLALESVIHQLQMVYVAVSKQAP